ncbi:hypothetical protein FIBSPDRAFT_223097 [Athelia psychrophila]|uniref:Uncharacterized protein n=1 Tax=Athelia psychrophila TaxID=1759441 RepID=A0A165YWL7_9AGAM|nr:hypothetical protein FIBSPDRAFT_223097 [Fibularhizoctonia sp. CBS 109695]
MASLQPLATCGAACRKTNLSLSLLGPSCITSLVFASHLTKICPRTTVDALQYHMHSRRPGLTLTCSLLHTSTLLHGSSTVLP